MTRETRIGLLVGLVFIVMFGLILTELTGTGKPGTPPVSLKGSTELALAPAEDISPAVVHPQDVPPRRASPIRPSPSPEAVLMAAGQDAPPKPAAPGDRPAPEVVAVVGRGNDTPPSPAAAPTLAAGSPRITSAADLAPLPAPVPAPSAVGPIPAAPARTYTVQAGDSLIKIARKVYGSDAPDGYKRILEANRDKVTDPSLVKVGQVLAIPGPTGAGPAAAANPPAVRQVELGQLADALASPAGGSPRQPSQRAAYVVQRGDTLTKIARRTLRDDSRAAVMSLFDANRSKLSDPDHLPVGAELVIPG